jgi:hypothetical protein
MRVHRCVVLCLGIPLLVFHGCSTRTFEPGDDLKALASWMTGSFSSEEQSLSDTSYFDIRLKMVRIWPEQTDAYWL